MSSDGRELKDVPYRRYLGIACGTLGWPPSEFWKSTVIELLEASEQWILSQGGEAAKKLKFERFKEELDGDS